MILLAAEHAPITWKRGDTFGISLPVVNTDGSPKDLSAAISVRYGWAKNWSGGPSAFSISLEDEGDVVIDTPEGGSVPSLVLVRVPDATMDGLTAGDYVDELEIVDAGGNRRTVWWGPIKLLQDVLA